MKTFDARPQDIAIRQLRFDGHCNRTDLSAARVKKIAADFDPDKFRRLEVSKQEDGTYLVMDGFHRVYGVKAMGWDDDQRLPCNVYQGLTPQQETMLFLGFNDSRAVSVIEKMLKRIIGREEIALRINGAVTTCGFVIAKSKADGHISAVAALERVYRGTGIVGRSHNYTELVKTLQTSQKAWEGTSEALHGPIIEGIGMNFLRENGNIDEARLVAKLAGVRGGAPGFLNRARTARDGNGTSLAKNVAQCVVAVYNRGLRTKKLANWIEL